MTFNGVYAYKFDRKYSNKSTYQVKITNELLEDLENFQKVSEVTLDVNEKIGTLTLQSKNSSKVYNLNIEPITKGEKESLELNLLNRSNMTIESVASLNVRLNVQATSKVYDMTKKKIIEVANENKKHCAKELKLPIYPNKSSMAYTVLQNKENRKFETTLKDNVQPKLNNTMSLNKGNVIDPKKCSIREKVLHLLALKPASRDILYLSLHRLGVPTSDRAEVEKRLCQLATVNNEGLYQLSSQFFCEIREDWPQFNDDNRKTIEKLKKEAEIKLSGQLKSDNKKPFITPPKSHHSDRQDTISPAESSSSSKTIVSNDEGFISGDKRSPSLPLRCSNFNKRNSQHLNVDNNSSCKKIRLSDQKQSFPNNECNSSSSCEVTPKSDVSVSSSSLKSKENKLYNNVVTTKIEKTNPDDIQIRFNNAYEEYMQLCTRLKERETEIDELRSQCRNAKTSDFARMYKVVKSLFDQLETPEFQKITARVKILELEMCSHVRILTSQKLK